MKHLAGTLIVKDGILYDYNFKESILNLLEFCDHVFVADGGSKDGTIDVLEEMYDKYDNLTVSYYRKEDWDAIHGKQKLVWLTDKAIETVERHGFEWQFSLQADEIVTEKSYESIREAINSGLADSYFCTRKNLWGNPNTELNVPQERKPCSTEVIRLAKTIYRAYGDAESLAVDKPNADYLNAINIWHYGFVRKREVMKAKIINMQEQVFSMQHHDPKLDQSDTFDSTLWFKGDDLKQITEPHHRLMQKWVLERL